MTRPEQTTKHISGLTTEGHPFDLILTYETGQEPVHIVGSYSSGDGSGTFSITKTSKGDFVLDDGLGGDQERHEKPEALIPWVISEVL